MKNLALEPEPIGEGSNEHSGGVSATKEPKRRPAAHSGRTDPRNLLVAVALAAATIAPACGGRSEATPVVKDVVLTIHHSRFLPPVVKLDAGTTARFIVRNTDPIDHELIVGPKSVQDVHEKGSHAIHGAVPGEVSIPAGDERATTYRFAKRGRVLIGCHLPGHWDYGMRGVIVVG